MHQQALRQIKHRQGEGRDLTEAWVTRGEIVPPSVKTSSTAVGTKYPPWGREWADAIVYPLISTANFREQYSTHSGGLSHLLQDLPPGTLQVAFLLGQV